MNEAVIVAALRTAVGKSPRGSLRTTRPDDMAADVIRALMAQTPQLSPDAIDDVILGCATPEGESGTNVARIASLRAGLPDSVPAVTVNRFCSSGSQTIAMAAERIMAGMADQIIAGGTESMSLVRGNNRFRPNPYLVENRPDAYLSMGLTAENVARKYGVSREDADAFAFRSHQRALAAQQAGKFADDGIVPLDVEITETDDAGQTKTRRFTFDTDEGPRADTTIEALAKLRPAFHVKGVVTAGNSSQTSDGAAAVTVMSRARADELGLKPLARFVSYAVGGVPPEIMGMGPVVAVPKALKRAGLTLADIDLIELNEAFAGQALAVMRELGLDESKVNVNGGAVALGHPLGASGAKLTVQLLGEMRRRGSRYGMVTMCVGGGQGAATIFENLQS
ncbi:MAG TPA: acetyl-CoA C-acyltransferase [Thermoanaerobaculia bacterium]|jgi:acetyl-CoA acyltransferase|nr:acetyl-CoA C-acyltransferase [Thermoanaerobaculia bacterium]